ncbi:MAG: cell division topological specificity factor MinE [Lachnospiraceae bacterium]|nr:cell division topological specificity factor MinE [Lachnospiraceae bacterium]
MRQILLFHKSNSGEIARNRLKLLLVSDQASICPGLIDLIKDDMIGVLSRYAEVDSSKIDLKFTKFASAGTREELPALSARIPLRQLTCKRNEECF